MFIIDLAIGFIIILSAFIVILLIVLVYEWRTGALDWGVLARRERSSFATRQETD